MQNRDYSSIIECNPGIAGSEYEFLLVPYLLELRNNGIEPYLLVNFLGKFPHRNAIQIVGLEDSCQYCIENNIEALVVDIKYFDKEVLDKFGDSLSIVIWAHNNVPYDTLDLLWKLPYIKKIVNCGREELELYRDHIATLKSTYIYNIFPFKDKSFYQARMKPTDNHNVVYMGSIVWAKGFHVLAKAWKDVLKQIPDAQLYVIGNGRLYNGNAKLGSYGIARADYEEAFIPYITDSKGNILSSVHFCGLLGDEKYDVLGMCKVAVPNPTGNSECLPITTMEMQLMGCCITTIQHPAYYDTVYNKDFLFKREEDLAKNIINRLKSKRDNYDDLYDYETSRFGIESNISKWENVLSNKKLLHIESCSNYYALRKSIKSLILFLKRFFPILNKMMPLDVFESKLKRHFCLQ